MAVTPGLKAAAGIKKGDSMTVQRKLWADWKGLDEGDRQKKMQKPEESLVKNRKTQKSALSKAEKIERVFRENNKKLTPQKIEQSVWNSIRFTEKPQLIRSALKDVQNARKIGDKALLLKAENILADIRSAKTVKDFYSAQSKWASSTQALKNQRKRQSETKNNPKIKSQKTKSGVSMSGLTNNQKTLLMEVSGDRKAKLKLLRNGGFSSGNLKTEKELDTRLVAMMKRINSQS